MIRHWILAHMYQAPGFDLTRIDGIDGHTAMKIISEIAVGHDTGGGRYKAHLPVGWGCVLATKNQLAGKWAGRTKPCVQIE